jgi:hypothetical protein
MILFMSDWREDVVFSWLRCGGNRSPEPFGLESFDPELTTEGLMAERPVEGNAEGVRIPRR